MTSPTPSSLPLVTLDSATIEEIAAAVVARLADTRPATGPALIDAAEVARRHGVTRSYVYDHAGDLGAIRLGGGTRARLRFNPISVAAYLDRGRPVNEQAAEPARRLRAERPVTPLLPIRGLAA